MFSGIIEARGTIEKIDVQGTNKHFTIASPLSGQLHIDQSVSHNGVCLTVVERDQHTHQVTAIRETLIRSTLDQWEPGDTINLERSITPATLLDGHLVQGHVDAIGWCTKIEALQGSWEFTLKYPEEFAALIVPKGSISIDGTSLTVVDPDFNTFRVAIIPYTYAHTRMGSLKPGEPVNLEFDIIGKYFQRQLQVEGWRAKMQNVS
ncbi:MAG: riboflavin synthase [Saprospiraceae bacterium]|nr:riboflavin synthase [Saprospiraceae bacterium]